MPVLLTPPAATILGFDIVAVDFVRERPFRAFPCPGGSLADTEREEGWVSDERWPSSFGSCCRCHHPCGRYEVGRFFGAVERLKRAAEEHNSREAQKAFASMSVAYDRYLKVLASTLPF